MKILLDTNILTRMAEPGHVQHQAALDSTDLLGKKGHDLVLVPQVLYEFWVVCTRPLNLNGLGRTAAEAETELAKLKSLFAILDDLPLIFTEWERLVKTHQIVGKNAHDCRLIAAMTIHNVTDLLTFNDKDFHRYLGITVNTPDAVLKPSGSP